MDEWKEGRLKRRLTSSPSSTLMASKSALPMPTMMMERGREAACTIAWRGLKEV